MYLIWKAKFKQVYKDTKKENKNGRSEFSDETNELSTKLLMFQVLFF